MRGIGVIRAILCSFASAGVTVARAESSLPALVWYRSAEACPDGTAFLARLEVRGVKARLARVGDTVDFVVTLGGGPNGASGLLERQTKTGAVAVRRIDGGTCDEVADGLALTLSLADTPERHEESPLITASPEVEAPSDPRSHFDRSSRDARVPARVSDPRAARRRRWALGVQGTALSGVAPDLVPGGALFVDFAPGDPRLPSGASARLSAFASTRGAAADEHDYRLWLVGGRLEACPVSFGSAALRASPCASVDLGTLRASGTGTQRRSNGVLWAALRAGLRLDFSPTDLVIVGAEFDAVVPTTRYDIVAGAPETSLYRTAPVGLGGGLGASFRFE